VAGRAASGRADRIEEQLQGDERLYWVLTGRVVGPTVATLATTAGRPARVSRTCAPRSARPLIVVDEAAAPGERCLRESSGLAAACTVAARAAAELRAAPGEAGDPCAPPRLTCRARGCWRLKAVRAAVWTTAVIRRAAADRTDGRGQVGGNHGPPLGGQAGSRENSWTRAAVPGARSAPAGRMHGQSSAASSAVAASFRGAAARDRPSPPVMRTVPLSATPAPPW